MRIYILSILLLTTVFEQAIGQVDSTTMYKKLSTKKIYSVNLSYQINNGVEIYTLNNKKVSKSVYDKYKSKWKNMETCCPCILKSYNENDILIREAVSCTDCGVGVFKDFYPNGKVKLSGRYKENPSGDWNNIWDRGFCNVQDGVWTYFNENGDTLYSEVWKNGEFIKQIPEQNFNEIWKVELLLNGESIDKKTLTPEQVKQLVVTPKYKNHSNSENNFSIKFQASATGYRKNEKTFTIDSLKNMA